MKIPCLLCLVFFFFACQSRQPTPKPTHVGFYYWQTTWQWNKALQNHYEKLGAKELYVRFFDLDWNENTGKVVPVAPLQEGKTETALPATARVTPTVFITNRAMYHLPDAEVEKVAEKIYQKIKAQWQTIFPALPVLQGIQLDCDWSGETREKFFKLCKVLKQKIAPAQLSATIRLHQIKYAAKTGIPPIDKGVLMCYNMGKMNGDNTQNSILDIDILQSYAPALPKYPLPLDIALGGLTPIRWIWSDTSYLSCLECPDPIVQTPLETTRYILTIVDENGCEARDEMILSIDPFVGVYIPNALGGTGNNATLALGFNPAVRRVNLFRIYDRWGEMLHESINALPGDTSIQWDGRFRGQLVNPGVYMWQIELELVDGSVLKKIGDLTVIR